MKKTGILFLILMGFAAIFLLNTLISGENLSQKNPDNSRHHHLALQQIPARLAQNPDSGHFQTSHPITDTSKREKDSASAIFQGSRSQEILSGLIGQWEQTKSNSKRILTIEENGTATMVIEPKGLWKTILGNQVTVNIEWSLNAGTLTLRTVGGNPENKLEYIKQVWGDEFTRKIHSIEDKVFTLRDDQGDVSQKWVRTSY